MIKNKILNIKIIFKILKTSKKYFKFPNRLLFYKTLEKSFQKLFSKIIFQNYFQKQLSNSPLNFILR